MAGNVFSAFTGEGLEPQVSEQPQAQAAPAANPFAAFTGVQPEAQQQPVQPPAPVTSDQIPQGFGAAGSGGQRAPSQQPVAQEGVVDKALIGLGAGLTNVGQEAKKLGLRAGEAVGVVPEGRLEEFTEQANREREFFAQTPVGQSAVGKGGQFVGEILPGLAIPGGAVGGVVTKILGGAAGGAAAGALTPTSDEEERITNMLLGSAFGGVLAGVPAAARQVKDTGMDIIEAFTRSGGRRAIRRLVTQADVAPAQKAASELGTFLSPAESTGFGDLIKKEAALQLGDDPALGLRNKLIARHANLSDEIQKLVRDIAPETPERARVIQEGYDAIRQARMSPRLIDRIETDPLLGSEWKAFQRNKGFRPVLAKMPDDSVAKLDEFQKFLRERADSAFANKKGTTGTALKEARKDITNMLDTTIPEYAAARREAALNITRKKLEEGLDSIKGSIRDESGAKVPSAIQFYQKFLKSDKAFKDVVRNLGDNSAEAQKALQLKTVLGALENSPLEKAFKTQEPLQTVRTGGFGGLGVAFFEALGTVRSRFHEGMLDFITDPNFSADLLEDATKLAASKEAGKSADRIAQEFTKVMSRVLARESASDRPAGQVGQPGQPAPPVAQPAQQPAPVAPQRVAPSNAAPAPPAQRSLGSLTQADFDAMSARERTEILKRAGLIPPK